MSNLCLCLESLRSPFLLPEDSASPHHLPLPARLPVSASAPVEQNARLGQVGDSALGFSELVNQAVWTPQNNTFNMESTSPEVPAPLVCNSGPATPGLGGGL